MDFTRELGTPLIQLANTWLLARNGVAPGAFPVAKPAAPTAPTGVIDPYSNPQALREYARAMNAQSAPGTPAAPPAGNANPSVPAAAASSDSSHQQTPPVSNELLPLLQNYGVLLLNALNGGMPGHHFGDHLTQLFGTATHAMIASQGEDALTRAMLSLPEFKMFGEARLKKFVFEFVNFEQLLEREDEEQPAPANG